MRSAALSFLALLAGAASAAAFPNMAADEGAACPFTSAARKLSGPPAPLPPRDMTYEALGADDKAASLWQQCTANATSGPWPPGAQFDVIMAESMSPTMNWLGDTMPPGRIKGLHSVGTVAQAKLVWNGNGNYTGVFKAGQADNMIIRFAVVWKPCDHASDSTCEPCPPCPCPKGTPPYPPRCSTAKTNFNPTLALKVLRGGVHSGNFFAMQNILPDGSWNVFGSPMSNHMPSTFVGGGKVTAKFHSVTDWGFRVGLSDMATWDASGAHEPSPYFPWQLVLYPDASVATRFPSEFTGDHYAYLKQIGSLEAGTTLYQVYAKDSPGAHQVHVGSLVMTSTFTTSHFGDTTLFFRHQAFEEDLSGGGARTKAWLEECPNETACKVCPFEAPCF